ncbi:Protein translocase subunit SecE [Candidatus Izimaplasma bacterium HR1]|jgi:preprotein translocase subunit SecE|uniref:preprotein translocase subunit SecE n=1 Tax=Candidatus Izimoplasma sp. HR1 TaxID=1541959 RepID=UPI0004F60FEF|nr:Protein translocase subunit SecE [Candidatus Izimaplasma bacterium HR1]
MAKKELQEHKPNRVLEILRTEYPFERILLGVLGAFVIVLGVYLLEGSVLEIRLTTWWIFNTALKRTIFSIFIILVGTIAFFMAVWPFFVPSIAEMRKVSWPNKKTIFNHSARVFGFIIIISLFFVLIDFGLSPFFDWINGLGQ